MLCALTQGIARVHVLKILSYLFREKQKNYDAKEFLQYYKIMIFFSMFSKLSAPLYIFTCSMNKCWLTSPVRQTFFSNDFSPQYKCHWLLSLHTLRNSLVT